MQTQRGVLVLIFLLFVVTACGSSSQAKETTIAAPVVDTQHIVQEVLVAVESKLDGLSATPASTVDADPSKQVVVGELEARLAGRSATGAPPVDVDEIAEAVWIQVESWLEQRSPPVPSAYGDLAAAHSGADIENALIRLYRRANPAVVYIVIPSVGGGSGFVFNQEGYIVTNNHVVENGRDFEVVFSNGERSDAELVGTDVDSDLAVIKVDRVPDGVEPVPLAETDGILVGQFVVAIGNPFGEQGSMSLGIVSGLGRSLPSQRGTAAGGSYSLPQVIQTDAPINPGNSGGPLLNLTGEVVGVNSAIASTTRANSGVGFSIPVAAVRQVVPSLVEKGEYVYPYMGASFDNEITLDEQSTLGLPQTQGAYIAGVAKGGPADAAGLIPANPNTGRGGDLIVEIDDQPIDDFSDLNSHLVFHTMVGQIIEITVLHGGEPVVVSLTLGARP